MYYKEPEDKKPCKNSRRDIFLLLLFFFYGLTANAQQNTIREKKYSFEFQLFANTNFNNETSQQLKFEYEIKRTLVVYKQQLSRNINFCLAGDTYVKDQNKTYNRKPYLKRAYFQYNNHDLSFSAGLLVSEQFKYQRKIWQLRYISKTFQNKFSYGENRNIGMILKHNLSSRFSYDLAITSGYYTPINNSSKKYQIMAGQTFKTNFCTFRLFNSIELHATHEHILSFFITKKINNGGFGLEAARKNNKNKLADEDQYGFSIFGNHSFSKNTMCFARYDTNKESVKSHATNIFWVGIQSSFKKHMNASLFYNNKDLDMHFYGLAVFIH
ncbi:hypothetical protein [Labilibaculum sp.]|uniref:hypothetical protein n=1 Tax=Labilibaculum sp. TaxID=2060723 RepID=UPI003564EB5C